jgi:hypothetical protein
VGGAGGYWRLFRFLPSCIDWGRNGKFLLSYNLYLEFNDINQLIFLKRRKWTLLLPLLLLPAVPTVLWQCGLINNSLQTYKWSTYPQCLLLNWYKLLHLFCCSLLLLLLHLLLLHLFLFTFTFLLLHPYTFALYFCISVGSIRISIDHVYHRLHVICSSIKCQINEMVQWIDYGWNEWTYKGSHRFMGLLN